MTDLLRVLPDFPAGQFATLVAALEKHGLSTSDLLTLDAADIARRTNLPLAGIRRLCSAVLDALHADLGVLPTSQQHQPASGSAVEAGEPHDAGSPAARPAVAAERRSARPLMSTASSLAAQWQTITTLDPALDRALGGGIPAGYVTEITGESGAGKTQFLLSLLLAVQLPPSHGGLGRPALYIATEAPLSTRRLAQMLAANPLFQRLPAAQRPSLDNIVSAATPDLESQDHILTFQVPVEVERRHVGLLVIDSVAANYRAEFERSARHGSNMAARSAELVRLGMHLRDLAQRHNLAVVVSNQVADRFPSDPAATTPHPPYYHPPCPPDQHQHQHQHNPYQQSTQESPLASRSRPAILPPPPPSPPPQLRPPLPLPNDGGDNNNNNNNHRHHHHHPALLLDHQQRWFTGWGDTPTHSPFPPLKTPSLGLVWTTQISARIALFRSPAAPSVPPPPQPPTRADPQTDIGRGSAVEGEGGGRGRIEGEGEGEGEGGVGAGPRPDSGLLFSGPGSRSWSGSGSGAGGGGTAGGGAARWRRWMKVVFAPHAGETGPGLEGAVEFEVWMGGLRAVGQLKDEEKKTKKK